MLIKETFANTHMDASTFSLFLQENYLDHFGEIKNLAQASEYLSLSDMFLGPWHAESNLDVYAASLSIRGLMFSHGINQKASSFRQICKPQNRCIQEKIRMNYLDIRDFLHSSIEKESEVEPKNASSIMPQEFTCSSTRFFTKDIIQRATRCLI